MKLHIRAIKLINILLGSMGKVPIFLHPDLTETKTPDRVTKKVDLLSKNHYN